MTPARRSLLTVLLIALAVRVGAALWLGLDGPPRGDERGYALIAESLAAGEGFRLPLPADVAAVAGPAGELGLRAFRAPLLPLVLAPLAALGGGLVVMRAVMALIGALGAPLLLAAGRPLLGDRAAFWAALGYALWPPHVFLSAHVLSEPLAMALLVPAAAAAARARMNDDGRAALAAGILGAFAVLARPAALLPAAFLVLVVGDRRRAVLLAAGFVALLAPWVVRNQLVLDRPLLTTSAGVTLVGGNGAAAAAAVPPGKWLPPERVYAGLADAPDLGMWGWASLGEARSDRRFAEDALGWIVAQPEAAARLAGHKLVRLFDPDPHSEQSDAPLKTLVGWLSLAPVLLLGLVGATVLRRGSPGWSPWLAFLAGTLVTAALFYGDARMRSAADPTLLLLAAAGARRILPAGASAS